MSMFPLKNLARKGFKYSIIIIQKYRYAWHLAVQVTEMFLHQITPKTLFN